MFGYKAIGSWTIATSPTITMRTETTIATIGRSMKNLAMGSLLLLGRRGAGARLEPDLLAWAYPIASLDHDAIAGLEPVRDDPLRADAGVDLDGADLDRLVAPDHRHLMDPLHVLHRALGNQQGVLPDLDDRADLRVLARPQHVAGVREHAAREDRAGGHVDLAIQ